MKKTKKIMFCTVIVCLVILFMTLYSRKLLNTEYILIKLYGNPIGEDGTINNEYFGIKCGENNINAKINLNGINKAIEYASNKEITEIKLKKGKYLIDSQKDEEKYHYQEKGIMLKTNVRLNLNGSTIKHISNNRNSYTLISILNVENASIFNGTLEGDRDDHIFENPSQQYGHGIDLAGGKTIEIYNLEVKNMIGDGIYVTNFNNEKKKKGEAQNIKIFNCNIYNCRRQGITIINGENIEIYQNEIHNIEGTAPQSCIDLETGNKEYTIKNIKIYENKLYSAKSNNAIIASKNTYQLDIVNNQIEGKIRTYNAENEINILNNYIKNGGIVGVLSEENINIENYYVKKIKIEGNELDNSYISLGRLNNAKIFDNKIKNGYIEVANMNSAIFNNKLMNDDTNIKYGCIIKRDDNENTKKYNVYLIDNEYYGKLEENVKNNENDNIIINYDKNKMLEYIELFENL